MIFPICGSESNNTSPGVLPLGRVIYKCCRFDPFFDLLRIAVFPKSRQHVCFVRRRIQMSDVGFVKIISIWCLMYNLADVAWNPFGKTGLNMIFLGYFYPSTKTKMISLGSNPSRIRSFWTQIPFLPRSFRVQFSAARGMPPTSFPTKYTPPPPFPLEYNYFMSYIFVWSHNRQETVQLMYLQTENQSIPLSQNTNWRRLIFLVKPQRLTDELTGFNILLCSDNPKAQIIWTPRLQKYHVDTVAGSSSWLIGPTEIWMKL